MEQEKVIRKLLEQRIALMAYISTIVGDRHHAEDLFQDLSVEAIDKADTLQDDGHLTRWLRTAARFRAIDHLRRTSSRSMVFDPELLDKLDAAWQARAEQPASGRVDALRDCMSSLPERAQKLMHLRYQEGLSGSDLAKPMQRSANAVYLMLSRVHKALRQCVEDRLSPEAGATR